MLTLGEKAKVDLTELVEAARSKLTLLARVTKLEDELVRVEAAYESLDYDYTALKETHDLTKRDYERRLTASEVSNKELEQQLGNLRTVFDELAVGHADLKKTVSSTQSAKARESSEVEMSKLKRVLAYLKEELETKEELLTSLKNVVHTSSSESDEATSHLQSHQKFHAQVVAQSEKRIKELEEELAKNKRGWIRDVQVMNALRVDKETLEAVRRT
jgi:chromosome segregation ATPase